MILVSALVSSVLSLVIFTNAAPSPQGRVGTIASQCTNISMRDAWLVGDCLTGNGTARITSVTYLNSKLANVDAVLVWAVDGYFGQSCRDCQLNTDNVGLNLVCLCGRNWPDTGFRNATINLDEHIGVYSGHLLSNLKGPPVVPARPSDYPIPSNFIHSVGGAATCVDWAYPNEPDWCQTVAPKCTNGPNEGIGPIYHLSPVHNCFIPSVYFDYPFQFSEIKIFGEGAWELTAYSDQACTKKIGTVATDTCTNFGTEKVRSYTTRPLFNEDPN